MLFEGFLMSLANNLGIPLGAKMRKYYDQPDKQNGDIQSTLEESTIKDFLNAIIDITKDDVCVGENPLFYQCQKKRMPKALKERCQMVCDAFNEILNWVAVDLLKVGVSTYTFSMKEGVLVFTPYLRKVKIFLKEDMTLKMVDEESNKEIENSLVFVYYDKSMLSIVEESDEDYKEGEFLIRVNPQGIQTKNLLQPAQSLAKCENSIERLRAQTSKVIRFASVEVGVSQGDKQQAVVDDISEGINANSQDLVSTTDFDDQIPVFPTRKGLGKPEYEEHFSQADLKQLADLDYNLSKVFLAMRFPKSYADFSQNLTPTAVSMIRGDIRYAKVLGTTQSLIEKTVNKFMAGIQEIKKAEVVFKLTRVPTSEDDDLISVLSTYTDFAIAAIDYVLSADSEEEAMSRLESLRVLYSTSTNAEGIENWAQSVEKVVKAKYSEPNPDMEEPPVEGDFLADIDEQDQAEDNQEPESEPGQEEQEE